jgi:chromosome segregation protein
VLESGIDVMVRPPGKKPKSISLLSGGERSLTAIALLFATYMVKPSPFCFLDEIDAALDEENVGRFLRRLNRFYKKTKFIMITQQKTMSIVLALRGHHGRARVSRIKSVKLDRRHKAAGLFFS